jgi:ABC-type bacteriocin/lantibiotic exporter with double-glycine peptidase domain
MSVVAPALPAALTARQERHRLTLLRVVGNLGAPSDLDGPLVELLAVLGWKGSPKELSGALPQDRPLDLDEMRDVLARLGYATEEVDPADAPLLTSPALHLSPAGQARLFSPGDPPPADGRILVPTRDLEAERRDPQTTWLASVFWELRSFLSCSLTASLFVNTSGLALPFFTRYVYDRAIPARSDAALFYLGLGVLLAVLAGTLFRMARAHFLAHAGGRLAYLAGTAALEKILSLPLPVLLQSGVDSHILRLRDLEKVREFVSGPFAATLYDTPFILIYLAAIGIMSGWLVLAPIGALVLYMLLIPGLSIYEDRAMRRASRINAERSAIQQDTAENLKDLIGSGLEERWLDNYAQVMAKAVAANRNYTLVASALRVVASTLSSGTALITVGAGIAMVEATLITPGDLIATMMLVWRATAPAQAFASSYSRYYQIRHSASQINRLMDLAGEKMETSMVSPLQGMQGAIVMDRLVFRYSAEREPALAGISLQVDRGEVIGVTGPNGAGKTTLLMTLAGLIKPQGGSVLIDGRDIRQFQPEDLRSWLGFVPEQDQVYHMTLRQNFLAVMPQAESEDIRKALAAVGAEGLEKTLPEGLDSDLFTERGPRLGYSLQEAVCIARTLLPGPPVLLIDEPLFQHDQNKRKAFVNFLNESKGRRTIIFTSHDQGLLAECDKILLLDRGAVVSFGPAAKNI